MRTFAGIEKEYAGFENAAVLFQSIPFDGTSTWGKGADKALNAFLEAAENMEVYDIETNSEVYKKGVYMYPPLSGMTSPEIMFQKSYAAAKSMLKNEKFVTFFGGEHSISIGVIKAVYEKYPDITILQIDAHADLRKDYMGTPYNHACAVHDASKNTNLVQVGIRSMTIEELEYLNRDHCFFAEDLYGTTDWMQKSIDLMGEKVYITFDLDALDPSIMPATGTPEPGGLDWNTTIRYLRKVFEQREVVGFDLVELAPIEGNKASNFLTAKLYYKMLSYKFFTHEK